MQSDMQDVRYFVGLKQSTEAVKKGQVKTAYVALDADEHVRLPFEALCEEMSVPVEHKESKAKLGKAFGINVSAAVAVVLK